MLILKNCSWPIIFLVGLIGSPCCFGMKIISSPKYQVKMDFLRTPEEIENKKLDVFVREQVEKILTEQPNSPDLINQLVQMRIIGYTSLLFTLIKMKLYDLANSLLDNKELMQDSLDLTLMNMIRSTEDEKSSSVLQQAKNNALILFDHDAKVPSSMYRLSKNYKYASVDRSYIDSIDKTFDKNKELKHLEQTITPTYSLYFSEDGVPVKKTEAQFFKPLKKNKSLEPYQETSEETDFNFKSPYKFIFSFEPHEDKESGMWACAKIRNILRDKSDEAEIINQKIPTYRGWAGNQSTLLLISIVNRSYDLANSLLINKNISQKQLDETLFSIIMNKKKDSDLEEKLREYTKILLNHGAKLDKNYIDQLEEMDIDNYNYALNDVKSIPAKSLFFTWSGDSMGKNEPRFTSFVDFFNPKEIVKKNVIEKEKEREEIKGSEEKIEEETEKESDDDAAAFIFNFMKHNKKYQKIWGEYLDKYKNSTTLFKKKNSDGDTFLTYALKNNDKDYAKKLLEMKNIDITLKNNEGQTALDIARDKGFLDIISMLESHKPLHKPLIDTSSNIDKFAQALASV